MMKGMNNRRYKLVGDLQVYAKPFASLYYKEGKRSLFLFVRTSEVSSSMLQGYFMPITVRQVQMYMDGAEGLKSILRAGKARKCTFGEEKAYVKRYLSSKGDVPELVMSNDYYDDEFCAAEPYITYFINRLNKLRYDEV